MPGKPFHGISLAYQQIVWYTSAEVIALQRIAQVIKRHRSLILYMLFGLCTTVVNYAVYFPLLFVCGLSAVLSNAIAWFFAVLFSFFTNKPFVFESKDWSLKTTLHEFTGFLGCRIFTGILETAALFLFVDFLKMDGILWKLIISVIVVIVNYIGNRLLVFKNK